MSYKPVAGWFVLMLVIAAVLPAAFFVAPQRVSAQASFISCLGSLLGGGAGGAIAGGIGAVASVPVSSLPILAETTISAGATTGSCLDTTILKPLARMLARVVLQQITASTINWINGKNGSGQPSFVTNLAVHLQLVGDSAALSLIAKSASAFNSPFGPVISQSLQTNYLQQTSLAGFFAANQCTLAKYSPNVNSFINGNWSQGGIPAFLALATQPQNNPYILNETALTQVGSSVTQAQTNRRQDLVQSQGFLSWCGTTAAADQTQSSAAAAYQQCQDTNGVNADCLSAYTNAGGSTSLSNGVNPGASCTNSDGTPGNIQTPGSVLHDYTSKAIVGTGIDQLVAAQDIDSALGAIAMALVNQVLGSTGLLGASSPTPGRPAITTQLQNYQSSNTSSAASANSIGLSTLDKLTAYQSAWQTIVNAEQIASSSVTQLASLCSNQANAVQTALATELAPVLSQSQMAISSLADTRALALKVQAESSAATTTTGAANLSADTQLLALAPPTAADVAALQQNAQVTNGARAIPAGALTVSGGTIVDQMNLIGSNAQSLKLGCGLAPIIDLGNSGGGG